MVDPVLFLAGAAVVRTASTKIPARASDGARTHFASAHNALVRDCESVSLHDDAREYSYTWYIGSLIIVFSSGPLMIIRDTRPG